jgi:hypothetical protein
MALLHSSAITSSKRLDELNRQWTNCVRLQWCVIHSLDKATVPIPPDVLVMCTAFSQSSTEIST